MKKYAFLFAAAVLALALPRCGLQIKPLSVLPQTAVAIPTVATDEKVVYRFFDEDYIAGGYGYWYPEASNVFIPEESGKNGEVSLQFDLVADDYSGGSVCLHNLLYDLTPYYNGGALQFWIRGAQGGENALVALVDEENTDGCKTVVRLPLNNYGGISKEWRLVTVPLTDFGKRGVFWDAKKKVELPLPFDWKRVCEFRIEIKKNENKEFRVWVDDIFILRDHFAHKDDSELDQHFWDERIEPVAPPPLAQTPAVNPVQTLFTDNLPAGAFTYVYGGKTATTVVPTTRPDNKGVLALYIDNNDYSGVSLVLGEKKSMNLSALRETTAAIAFWAKGGPGTTKTFVGFLDDESDGAKVQTKLALADFGQLDTTWTYFMIPLRRFLPQGLYWDEARQAEIAAQIDWGKIAELRFSANRYENKVPEGEPATLYFDNITIIDSIPGYVDPEQYWASFASDSKDLLLHDFENGIDNWETSFGPKSEISLEAVNPKAAHAGTTALKITYKLGDYCDAICHYTASGFPREKRNWNNHWGLRFSLYTQNAFQGVTVQINDSGNEIFVASAGGRRGWNEILVPFKAFNKFIYYQPDDAVQNGRFDLDNVRAIDFKPAGEGTRGEFIIDNVILTNMRELEQPPAVAQVQLTATGSFDKTVTAAINPGIFGINVALWDGDLLDSKTVDYVKAINHGVLRYPGGLRADEDNWKEVLAKKDWMVDTDEYLDFLKKTNTTGMITVNFGKGTPQEAADWVHHVNIKRKAAIKYWEIGNELYGDWHPDHCSAEEYGKRAATFITAMKAVDPTILVTVVWVLDGEWNKIVFDHTKELADGVIVHHYPQHAKEENDFALLAAPQSLDQILPSVRKQVKEYGNADRKYQIWLTEWNSVDFNPGPQTLSLVNGLFVADYLGMLAKHNIEQASYWDVHNNLTPEGGDYGYLSRTGAPDGDNVPRPSYYAFKLASQALRGSLKHIEVDSDDVTAYLARHDDGTAALLMINKMQSTTATVQLQVDGLVGTATVRRLSENENTVDNESNQTGIKKGSKIDLPPRSATSLMLPGR